MVLDKAAVRLRQLANKLAVESEPGLTTAQLMVRRQPLAPRTTSQEKTRRDGETETREANSSAQLTNFDLKLVEPERRQWGTWNYVALWIADSFNINTWMISSSMIVAGLSWWQSWICVWIGYAIAACFVCLTGRIGATYHVGFPVVSRASFGIWGSLWPVFNRAAIGEFN